MALPAAAIVVAVAAQHDWSTPSSAAPPAFESLVGQRLGRWTVVRVHPQHLGAVPVVLATEQGQRYQVDVLARDPEGVEGVANTERFSLFVVNSTATGGAAGQRPTDEEQGLGAMMLAQALASEPAPPGLLTHAERSRQHPQGAFAVPLS